MRLICPNCGAQYEVPIEVIPSGGRDVQCSNCGHTWYQRHPDDDPELAEDLEAPLPEPAWEPEPEPAPRRAARAPEIVVNNQTDDDAAPADAAASQRRLDPSVAEVLREEAELEKRRREAEALESQPDLGLEEPDEDEQARRARQSRERMAKMRGEPAAPSAQAAAGAAAMAAAQTGSRKDLLPDVEEINQTLRSSAEPRTRTRAPEEAAAKDLRPAKRSGSFGRGFFLVLLLVAAAVALYVFAPQISEAVPQAAPFLDTYVAQVNTGRAWLDTQVQSLLVTLDGLSSESAGAGQGAPEATATEGN